MEVLDLSLAGIKLVRPKIFYDERGFFGECYRKSLYSAQGISCEFVQDNHSYSKKGTLRGMHFQRNPGQAKLVTVAVGKIFDVVVDIRKESPTFGQWLGICLDDVNHEQLYIPVGFAHGFCVLSEEAHVFYKVSSVYDPKEEKGFRFDDPDVGIEWPLIATQVSQRDQEMPYFQSLFKIDEPLFFQSPAEEIIK